MEEIKQVQTEEVKKEAVKISEYRLEEVPTGYGKAIVTPEGKQVIVEELMIDIANKVEYIKRAIAR